HRTEESLMPPQFVTIAPGSSRERGQPTSRLRTDETGLVARPARLLSGHSVPPATAGRARHQPRFIGTQS
ncbi:MAG: hypothetical protein R6W83_11455, partial [Cryobacterium sp.]